MQASPTHLRSLEVSTPLATDLQVTVRHLQLCGVRAVCLGTSVGRHKHLRLYFIRQDHLCLSAGICALTASEIQTPKTSSLKDI